MMMGSCLHAFAFQSVAISVMIKSYANHQLFSIGHAIMISVVCVYHLSTSITLNCICHFSLFSFCRQPKIQKWKHGYHSSSASSIPICNCWRKSCPNWIRLWRFIKMIGKRGIGEISVCEFSNATDCAHSRCDWWRWGTRILCKFPIFFNISF